MSYRVALVVDGLLALAMSFPALFFRLLGQTTVVIDAPLAFALRLGAALMFGWALLLLWADRRPEERREVLILTALVIVGMALAIIYALSVRLIALEGALLTWWVQIVLLALFWHSYSLPALNER
jgi:hypothetical protein